MDVAFELTPLVASKLIVYTFGTLLHLFLMVLILGQRRLRRVKWLLFLLMASLFMWNSGNLLALNVGLVYGVGPAVLSAMSRLIPFVGFMLVPPLLVHVHEEYAAQFRATRLSRRILVAAFYLPWVSLPWLLARLLGHLELHPLTILRPFARPLAAWLIAALLVGTAFNVFSWTSRSGWIQDRALRRFHVWVAGLQVLLAAGLAWVYLMRPLLAQGLGGYVPTFLMLVAIVPSGLMGYSIFRYNFLDLRVQRNVAYSVAAIFALLIYLNGIRRLSGYLEGANLLPAAVTEGVMIFLLVVFLEPVKKVINQVLRAAFLSMFERVQRLAAEIYEHAKQSGDIESLKRFVEERIPRELGLERVRLRLSLPPHGSVTSSLPGKTRVFPIRRGEEAIATLNVVPVSSDLSGEQFGALQLLADQLAAALELCQLISDKVKLERALAEKAKMAFLGEMATRIAHNVKNPLSSMKTLVQLLEEDGSLPERARQDCRMIVGEIDRLNHSISQILRYAKPARDTDRPVDLVSVVGRVLALTRAEAERRRVRLEFDSPAARCPVAGGEEATSDIVSNLIVNALEASPSGGVVRIRVAQDDSADGQAEFCVEDQGPGIPAQIKEKMFQPFVTTRSGGTGLGLAIVARRAEEVGGTVEFVSPLVEGQGGTSFRVRFRSAG